MLCNRVRNLLSAYCDREITGSEMLAIRRHLNECGECEREHDSLLTVKRLLGGMGPQEPPRPFDPAMLDLSPRPGSRWRGLLGSWMSAVDEVRSRSVEMDRWTRRTFPTFHSQTSLVAAVTLSLGVVSALALQRAQPSDAVMANVPEVIAAEELRPVGHYPPMEAFGGFRSVSSEAMAPLPAPTAYRLVDTTTGRYVDFWPRTDGSLMPLPGRTRIWPERRFTPAGASFGFSDRGQQ